MYIGQVHGALVVSLTRGIMSYESEPTMDPKHTDILRCMPTLQQYLVMTTSYSYIDAPSRKSGF